MPPRLDCLPPKTRALYARLRGEPLLEGLVMVGGSALALQIGHRLSEDLDFADFAPRLPAERIAALMAKLESQGCQVTLLTSQADIARFRVDTGQALLDYARDYVVDGAKLTFFALGEAAPAAQRTWLSEAPRAFSAPEPEVLGLPGIFALKMLLLARRARSRDLFDLMTLVRDHGCTLEQGFGLVGQLAPIEQRDIERHKAVMLGLIPLDAEDEGFDSIDVNTNMAEMYAFFDAQIAAYEQQVALETLRQIRRDEGHEGHEGQ